MQRIKLILPLFIIVAFGISWILTSHAKHNKNAFTLNLVNQTPDFVAHLHATEAVELKLKANANGKDSTRTSPLYDGAKITNVSISVSKADGYLLNNLNSLTLEDASKDIIIAKYEHLVGKDAVYTVTAEKLTKKYSLRCGKEQFKLDQYMLCAAPNIDAKICTTAAFIPETIFKTCKKT